MASITDYTRKATREILNLSLPAVAARTFTCPKCKTGHIIVREKSARCDNKGCGLTVYRRFLNKELTDQHLEQLFSSGSTRLIKGIQGKEGRGFRRFGHFRRRVHPDTLVPQKRERQEKEMMKPSRFAGQRSQPARFHRQGLALRFLGKIILARGSGIFPENLACGGGLQESP